MEEQLDCGILIKQIHDELRKNANNAMRSQGITMAQLEALIELGRAPEQQRPLKELEQHLHVAQSTAAGIITRLEQKGFVESFSDAADRRVKLVRMTAEGMECANSARKHRAEAEARLLSGLTETEKEILLTLLKKVRNSLM